LQATGGRITHLQQHGVSIRAMAWQLGIDRHTVRRALRREGLPSYSRTIPRASTLAPFKSSRDRRLVECPELTAVRLLQEIQAQGYAGRCAILRAFLRPRRQEHRRLGQLTVRFETAPGEQGQIDGGHFGTIRPEKARYWESLSLTVGLTIGFRTVAAWDSYRWPRWGWSGLVRYQGRCSRNTAARNRTFVSLRVPREIFRPYRCAREHSHQPRQTRPAYAPPPPARRRAPAPSTSRQRIDLGSPSAAPQAWCDTPYASPS
jgi:hypothetical protein